MQQEPAISHIRPRKFLSFHIDDVTFIYSYCPFRGFRSFVLWILFSAGFAGRPSVYEEAVNSVISVNICTSTKILLSTATGE